MSKKKNILIAEDDPAIAEALSLILEDAGYNVNTVSNGKHIKSMRAPIPDLILLDIWMPGISGNNVCKKLKSNERTKHIPIFFISAHSNIKEITNQAGADGYISKPFNIRDVLKIVHSICNSADSS